MVILLLILIGLFLSQAFNGETAGCDGGDFEDPAGLRPTHRCRRRRIGVIVSHR